MLGAVSTSSKLYRRYAKYAIQNPHNATISANPQAFKSAAILRSVWTGLSRRDWAATMAPAPHPENTQIVRSWA